MYGFLPTNHEIFLILSTVYNSTRYVCHNILCLFIPSDYLYVLTNLYVLTLYVLSLIMFFLFIRFVVLRFVFLYVLSLYVLSFYTVHLYLYLLPLYVVSLYVLSLSQKNSYRWKSHRNACSILFDKYCSCSFLDCSQDIKIFQDDLSLCSLLHPCRQFVENFHIFLLTWSFRNFLTGFTSFRRLLWLHSDWKSFFSLIVFSGPGTLFFVSILLCRPSEDSLLWSTIPDGSSSKDWQSIVGWGDCRIRTRDRRFTVWCRYQLATTAP